MDCSALYSPFCQFTSRIVSFPLDHFSFDHVHCMLGR